MNLFLLMNHNFELYNLKTGIAIFAEMHAKRESKASINTRMHYPGDATINKVSITIRSHPEGNQRYANYFNTCFGFFK